MTLLSRIQTARPSLSFEFFPPKDDVGFWDLYRTIESLRPLEPTYVSVTYGAGGSTRRKTVDLVKRIQTDARIDTVAHLTCVGSTADEIATIVHDLRTGGVNNILALRGDPPAGQTEFPYVEGGFRYASELISFLRARFSDLVIFAACYPEMHPEAASPQQDMDNLKRKVDAGVDLLVSQLFFDNRDYYDFRDRAEKAGITVPIIAGIMPVQSVAQIRRFTTMCGAKLPPVLLKSLEGVEDDPEAVRHIGTYHAAHQCADLIQHDVPGIHFYTLNRSTATRAIYQQIKGLLPDHAPAK